MVGIWGRGRCQMDDIVVFLGLLILAIKAVNEVWQRMGKLFILVIELGDGWILFSEDFCDCFLSDKRFCEIAAASERFSHFYWLIWKRTFIPALLWKSKIRLNGCSFNEVFVNAFWLLNIVILDKEPKAFVRFKMGNMWFRWRQMTVAKWIGLCVLSLILIFFSSTSYLLSGLKCI